VPQRIIDSLRQSSPVSKINVDDVCDRVGIEPAEFRISFDLYVLQKFPNLRIFKTLRLELFLGHFAIDQRDRGDVRQTMIGRFTRLGFPFFRFATDDVD
jgi:hypothetical protein